MDRHRQLQIAISIRDNYGRPVSYQEGYQGVNRGGQLPVMNRHVATILCDTIENIH